MSNTKVHYDQIIDEARTLFRLKQQDYGPSWTIMRPASLTDQMYIKAARIRSLEDGKTKKVDDDVRDDYIGLINYGIMGLIQNARNEYVEWIDLNEILKSYDREIAMTYDLMIKKNHDYGEAWRMMRVPSMTDLILVKLLRIKSIEDQSGQTRVSESAEAGYRDIINYAVFALILLDEVNAVQIK